MMLLNYSHPLTGAQMRQVEALIGGMVTVRTIPAQLDHAQSFVGQVAALLDATGLTPDEWQTTPLLVNLPGYAPAAGCLLAEIHGRSGHFPAILRLYPVEGSVPTVYAVGEIVDLQRVRDAARTRRQWGE